MDMRVENLKDALAEVQRRTRLDKCEHGLLLCRETGKVLAQSQGNRYCVMVPDHPARDGRAIFVHSHPGETPMSIPDHMCAAGNSIPIYAVTPQGWVSWSHSRSPMSDADLSQLYHASDSILDGVGAKMQQLGYWFDKSKLEGHSAAEMWNLGVQAQITNAMMNRVGLMRYRFAAPRSILESLDKDTKRIIADTPAADHFKSWAEHSCYRPAVEFS